MGYPASMILELACHAYVLDEPVTLEDSRLPSFKPIPGCICIHKVIRYLENKRLLLTTEVNTSTILIMPNTTTAWFHPSIEAFCWPHLHEQFFEENENFQPSEKGL